MPLPNLTPLGLQEIGSSFDDDEWLFEIKHDGFRALAFIESGTCRLVSRNNHTYKRLSDLRDATPDDLKAKDAILDGEVAVLDESAKSLFNELLRSHSTPIYAAFDLL